MKTKAPRPLDVSINAQFKVDLENPPTIEDDFAHLFLLRQHVRKCSPKLEEWFLTGETKEEAFHYAAFDDKGPTTAATAVLRERTRSTEPSSPIVRSFSLWNGESGEEGASMQSLYRQAKEPSFIYFNTRLSGFLSYANVLSTVLQIVQIWKPLFVTAGPYFYDPVFKDRPGVAWMLYLPRVITVQQIPESRALVPVMEKLAKGGEVQSGTVIASIADEAFSNENPEHVRLAHAMEIRLADQDLLPRYADGNV